MWQAKKKSFSVKPIQKQRIVWLFLGVCLFIVIYMWIGQMKNHTWHMYKIELCLADCFVIIDESAVKGIFFMPMILWSIAKMIKWESHVQFIIREKSKYIIWWKQSCKVVKVASIFTVYQVFFTWLGGTLHTTKVLNWHETYTYFWVKNGGEVLAEGSVNIVEIIFDFALVALLTNLFIGFLFLLIWWTTGNIILGWALCMSVCTVEGSLTSVHIFYNKVNIAFYQWWNGGSDYLMMLYGISIVGFLWIMGWLYSSRKEFLYG